MCGIAGALCFAPHFDEESLRADARRMTEALAHRGPDDADVWTDAAAGVCLGHTRLSIIDLSEAGRQPMASSDSRWWIVFNGEIYNYAELRDELARHGIRFRGHSDTEAFLAGIAQWGVEQTLRRSLGMFAFAVW